MATLQMKGVESKEHTCQETGRVRVTTMRSLEQPSCKKGSAQTFPLVKACTEKSIRASLNE